MRGTEREWDSEGEEKKMTNRTVMMEEENRESRREKKTIEGVPPRHEGRRVAMALTGQQTGMPVRRKRTKQKTVEDEKMKRRKTFTSKKTSTTMRRM